MWLVLAILAARIQYYATKPRRSFFNGIMTIPATLKKKIDAPMNYRVLMPYLVKATPRMSHENSYEIWRVILLWASLVCVNAAWGASIAFLWLIFVMSAQIHDTWCYTGEAIGISLCLLGNPYLAALGIVLHGLSRETVLITGFVYWLATGDVVTSVYLGALSLAVFFGVRIFQGEKPLYCNRFMIAENIKMLRKPKEPFILYAPYINLIVIFLALVGAYLSGRIGWVVPVILGASVTMGRIDEYRLQIAVAPWIGLAIERML